MSYLETISSSIEKIIVRENIESYIEDSLFTVKDPHDLVCFFRRFITYNQHFPGAVAHLVGALHFRADLFNDNTSTIIANSDRSSLIASGIFFAAEDEYALKDRCSRLTHRSMAQQILAQAIDYAGWSDEKFNKYYKETDDNGEMFNYLHHGYRVGSFDSDEGLFKAIGFHLGSERLADIEFNLLHKMLVKNHPLFVKKCKYEKGYFDIPVYNWVASHMAAEIDHFKYGLIAASDSIEYYSGKSIKSEDLMEIILSGFYEFIKFQKVMFSELKRERS